MTASSDNPLTGQINLSYTRNSLPRTTFGEAVSLSIKTLTVDKYYTVGVKRVKVYQSTSEFIEAETDKEANSIMKALTFPIEKFKGDKEYIRVYEEIGRRMFQVPRYAHTLFDTKYDRMDIDRDDFTTKIVKYPPFQLELRGEQEKAVKSYLKHEDDNVLVLPPASGKTILALYIAQLLKQKTIILVHRSAFFNVWKNDIKKAFNLPSSAVGEIRGNKREIGDIFTLATFQTLYSRDYDVYDEFGLVIGDECFEGSTLVDMADGTKKRIKDIKNGDEVVGGTVTNKFVKLVNTTIKISAGNRYYKASLRHPILTVNVVPVMNGVTHRYELKRVMSKDLKIGDLLAVRISRKLALQQLKRDIKYRKHVFFRGNVPYMVTPVTDIMIDFKPTFVYDFTTTTHTFVANSFLTSNCHRVPADTFSAVTSRFSAKYMMGVTGTFERNDGLHTLTTLYLGRIAYYNDESDLNHVEKARIFRIDTDSPIPLRRGENVHHMYHKLLIDRDRFLVFKTLFDFCHRNGRKQLVFMHSVLFAELYAGLLNSMGYKVMLSVGGDDKRNARAKQLMLEGKLDAIVATVAYLREGESINNLDTAHFLTPISNKTDWIQCIGRVQRKHDTKKPPLVFDYVDNLVTRTLYSYENRVRWSKEVNSHRYEMREFRVTDV